MTYQEMDARILVASNLEAELRNSPNGVVSYKASKIKPSHSGWFISSCGNVCAPTMSELIFDLDSLQVNIDYDAAVKESKALASAFGSFTGEGF